MHPRCHLAIARLSFNQCKTMQTHVVCATLNKMSITRNVHAPSFLALRDQDACLSAIYTPSKAFEDYNTSLGTFQTMIALASLDVSASKPHNSRLAPLNRVCSYATPSTAIHTSLPRGFIKHGLSLNSFKALSLSSTAGFRHHYDRMINPL
jgi:hypothetical protein